jgi:hypothetical protein
MPFEWPVVEIICFGVEPGTVPKRGQASSFHWHGRCSRGDMTYKQTMTIHKPLFQSGFSGFSFVGIIARLKNAVKVEVPVGYQDETGFHTGVKPEEKEIKWPATW